MGIVLIAFWIIIFPSKKKDLTLCIIDEELTYVLSLAVPHASLALAVLISYCIASGRDPGKLRTDPNLDFMELLQKFSPTDLCPDCEVIRTRRSRHCAICNVCIEGYDHHCPWVNNCVGVRNHNSFLAFLASTWLFILFSIGAIITSKHLCSNSNRSLHPFQRHRGGRP